MRKQLGEDQETKAMRALAGELLPLYSASVDAVADALGISARHVQRLVLEGTLPAPSKHGCYDLPACVRAHGLYERDVTIPTSFAAALARLMEARDVLEECVRRYPAQRPAFYATARGCLWPLRSLDALMAPQRLDLRAMGTAATCAILGVSAFALEAAFPGGGPVA